MSYVPASFASSGPNGCWRCIRFAPRTPFSSRRLCSPVKSIQAGRSFTAPTGGSVTPPCAKGSGFFPACGSRRSAQQPDQHLGDGDSSRSGRREMRRHKSRRSVRGSSGKRVIARFNADKPEGWPVDAALLHGVAVPSSALRRDATGARFGMGTIPDYGARPMPGSSRKAVSSSTGMPG